MKAHAAEASPSSSSSRPPPSRPRSARQIDPNGTGGTLQNANPVSGGEYEDLMWVKTLDANGGETSTPIGRNPNFRRTTGRYGPGYARLGARLTF